MGHWRWVARMDSSADRSASKAAMTDGSGRTMQRISSGLGESRQSILEPLLRPMRLAIAAGMVIWFFPVTVVIMGNP